MAREEFIATCLNRDGECVRRAERSNRRPSLKRFAEGHRPSANRAFSSQVSSSYYCRELILQVLEDPGRPHTAADAHGDEAVLRAAPLHLVDQLDRELGARRAHRVAERYGAAVDVGLLEVHPDLADHGERLGGEGLVELDEVDIVDRKPGLLQYLRDRHGRSYTHDFGPDATDGESDKPHERCEPAPLGLLPVHHNYSGR